MRSRAHGGRTLSRSAPSREGSVAASDELHEDIFQCRGDRMYIPHDDAHRLQVAPQRLLLPRGRGKVESGSKKRGILDARQLLRGGQRVKERFRVQVVKRSRKA